MNLIYNLLSKAAKLNKVEVGQEITIGIDYALAHDGSMPKVIEKVNSSKQEADISYGNKLHVTVDHYMPAPNAKARQSFKEIKNFCEKNGINLYKNGEGILHQVFVERFGKELKDKIVVGVDGHMCTSAGLGALPFSITPDELAEVLATSQYKILVPKVIKIGFNGEFLCDDEGRIKISGKDIALYLIKLVGNTNLKGNAVLLSGDALSKLTNSQRMTICNMLGEIGAKTVYLVDSNLESSPDYNKIISINASDIDFVVALPGAVENVVSLREAHGKRISQVYIGGCTNGRLDDMEIVAETLKSSKVHEDVTLIVSPASRRVANEMDRLGYSEVIRNSGGIIINPGCGACSGLHQGVLSSADVVVTTTPRNTTGRMGDDNAQIYLASPRVAAIAAVEGMI